MMDYLSNKKNGTAKEEGELTDDDEEENNFVRSSRNSYSSREHRGASRNFSVEQSKNYELGNKFGPKRRDTRRRAEADNRRSSRTAPDGGFKKHHREHQDFRQTSVQESHTPSKIWANRRFRASSVRPLSPKHGKPSGPRRTDSPQSHRYWGQDSVGEGQDELEILEREQKRIREQLKSLEEEEQNDGSSENNCVLESLDVSAGEDLVGEDLVAAFSETNDTADLNYLLEAEKSEDDEIDVQELRRLALATSERHLRLMATEPQTSQSSIPNSDVVVIPDVEPDLPEPEVVIMVDEEEEHEKKKNSGGTDKVAETSDNLTVSRHAKKKSKKSDKQKKKGLSNINSQSGGQDKVRTEVKSKVTLPSPKKSKSKKHKKGDAKQEEWGRQRDELRILLMDNTEKALEKLLKYANEWEGKEKPIVTGTIKDFKRQKQIPVLSDKRAVQSFSQKSVDKKAVQEKSKESKEQDKKSGQLQDNYEEVEMDIDSNAEDEEEHSNLGGLHFGEGFSQAMLPVSSYENLDSQDAQQSTQHLLLTPIVVPALSSHQLHSPAGIPFEGSLPPPMPLPIPPQPPLPPPPPPPPHPPSYELEWNNKQAVREERIVEVMGNRIIVSKDESRSLLYQEERMPVYQEHLEHHNDLIDAAVPDIYLTEQAKKAIMECKDFRDVNRVLHTSGRSLGDDIGRQLRLIRHKQENSRSESQGANWNRDINMFPGMAPQRYTSDDLNRSVSQLLIPLVENSCSSEDMMTTDLRAEHYPSMEVRRISQPLLSEDLYRGANSPSVTSQRNQSEITGINSLYDFPSEIDEYVDLTQRHRRPLTQKNTSYKSSQKPVRKVSRERSPSPSRRVLLGEHVRSYSRDRSGSPHSPAYSGRQLLSSLMRHQDKSYSPPQRSASREHLREHFNERASVSSPYVSRKWQHEHHHPTSSSPHEEVHGRRSNSLERADVYEPEVPPTKKLRRSSPPPYIPTSITPSSTFPNSQVPQHDHLQSSDSEEEDPIALRNRLLAEVTEKRKTIVEGPSSNSTPSGMSPKQDSTHSEPSETFFKAHRTDELSVDGQYRLKTSHMIAKVSQDDEDEEEEDMKPPPVINRLVRRYNRPPTLVELSKRILTSESHDYQQEQSESHDQEQHSRQAGLKYLDLNMDQMCEEENEGLSKTDLENLRAFIIRSQTHAPERRQRSVAVEDEECNDEVRDRHVQEEKPCTTSSSSQNHLQLNLSEKPHSSSGNSMLKVSLKSSTGGITTDYDEHKCIKAAQGVNLITSCPVTSTNTPESSDIPGQSPSFVENTKVTKSASPLVCSQFTSSELSSSTSSLVTTSKVISSVRNKAKTVPQYYPAPSLDQRLEPSPSSAARTSLIKTSFAAKSQLSLGSSTSINVFPGAPHSNQSFEQRTHLRPGYKSELVSKSVSEVQTQSTADSTGLLTSSSVNITANGTAASLSSTAKTAVPITQQSHKVHHNVITDSSKTTTPFSDRSSLSSYSSQSYASGATSGPRMYSNARVLPVHPKVLVPLSSDSDGEDEEENGRQTSESALSAQKLVGVEEQDIDMLLGTQGTLAEVQGNEGAATRLLKKQEELLSAHEQSIQKDQKAVKLLVKRAVKFLEAQQQEEEKQQQIRAQLLELSLKMKTAEKLVMVFRAEKEQAEKQVQIVTEKLLRKKRLYMSKAKSVMSLGTKLLGPTYVSQIIKSQESASQEKQSLTRAQRIVQEKLKLMEKEKQIAEKLRKLKEAKVDKDTVKPTTVEGVSDMFKSSGPKWKSQDVIRIDSDAKPDISVRQRRKSLLEMNPSTTPNIPLTLRRSTSVSNAEKENISEAAAELKQVDNEVNADLSTAFRMPSGTQLTNFCKLQREKTQKYLKSPCPSSVTSVCSYPSLTSLQTTVLPKIRLQNNERTVRHSQDDLMPFVKMSHAYSSPLLMFRSYRFNSYFRTKENLCLQSSTYSHKINPSSILCPYDLQGTCNDDSCKQLHPKDYKLSDHELLEDIVSYCPRLAGAADGASPGEVKKCIVTFVDNILSKHKGKMTIDDLCLWLLSQANEASGKRHPHTISLEPRVWRPQPKEETGLSLDLDQKLTRHGVEAINMDRKVTDKDTIVNEEDVRYFAGDITELLSLEADIMADQTNIQFWQKLASKKLSDPNKSPKECLDQALSVLARALEVNRNDPDLWHRYLTLYKRHAEVKDFPEFCQTALEYAPSYELWFLYLESLKTYSEKDEVSTQALHFLCNVAKEARTSSALYTSEGRRTSKANAALESNSEIIQESKTVSEVNSISEMNEGKGDKITVTNEMCEITKVKLSDIHVTSDHKNGMEIAPCRNIAEVQENNDRTLHEWREVKVSGVHIKPGRADANAGSLDWKKLSHQTLEMVLYKTCLNLHTGRLKTALHFLQMVLGLKKAASFTLNVAELLTSADLLVLWLTYIHVLEWHQLPQHLYSMANQNPGRLMAKENIILPWSTKASLHVGVDSLVKLHDKAAKVWEVSEKDEETTAYYVKLIQSQVALLMSQSRNTEAVAKCRSVLSDKRLVDVWLTAADLYASFHDSDTVKQVFSEALSANSYSSKLQFYQSVFLHQQGEAETAIKYLQQFAVSHFDISPRNLHHYSPCQLYSQLLKQEEAFSLHMAQVKEEISDSLHKDIYLWLCYSLLLELQGKTSETVEIFERSLTHAQTPDDLILVWQKYISYLMRSRTPPKEVRDVIIRSIISVPTKFPVPFSALSSAMWVDYYHSNRLVEAWLAVLLPEDALDFMEMCLGFMPNNIQLLLRAVDLCLDLKETRRAYSWCKFVAAQADRPANLAFWKMAIALAQVEGTPREVERMLIGCIETMPLAVSGWKDFLLFEVTRENLVAIQKLLTYCQQLELNIEGFVATLSAPS